MANEERAAYWQQVLERWQKSGLTKEQFCRQEDISVKRLYYWRRRIEQRKKLVSRPKVCSLSRQRAFVPITVVDRSGTASNSKIVGGITIQLRSGDVVQLSDAVEADVLVKVIRALENRVC